MVSAQSASWWTAVPALRDCQAQTDPNITPIIPYPFSFPWVTVQSLSSSPVSCRVYRTLLRDLDFISKYVRCLKLLSLVSCQARLGSGCPHRSRSTALSNIDRRDLISLLAQPAIAHLPARDGYELDNEAAQGQRITPLCYI